MGKKLIENTIEKLRQKNEELQLRLDEAEEALNAIRNGEVDAIIVSGKAGEKVFTLTSADTPYRIILEEMAEGAVIINRDGTILYYNQRFSDIYYDFKTLNSGSNLYDVISDEEKDKFKDLLEQGLSERVTGTFSYNSPVHESPLYLNLVLSPLPDEVAGDICIIISDITKNHEYQIHLNELVSQRTHEIEQANQKLSKDLIEIKNAQEALLESEEQYRAFFECSIDAILITTPDGGVLAANPAAVDMFQMTEEELKRDGRNAIADISDPRLESALAERVNTGRFRGELNYRRRDGTVFPVDESNVVYKDKDGSLKTVMILRDVTQRNNAEKAIRDAQTKLNIALENGNIGIWEWNLKTDEMIWDERMEKMFGIKPGTFGKTFKAFEDLIHEEDLSHVHLAIKESLKNDLSYETIFRYKSNDDTTKYFSTKGIATKDIYGKPICLNGVCFDITSLREGTEKLVVKLNEDLLRSNKELASFAYVASHDLQEPLRMVTSFTQLLEQKYKDKLDQDALDYIHYAVDGAKRMYDLINGLLAYSRIQTKGKSFSSMDLNEVLENVKKNLAIQIFEKKASIEIEELPIVFADESQMIQLFQNLISNSLKFSSKPPRIHISSSSDTLNNIISVKDDGIGIEPEYFERIFQIFQRLLPKEEYDGTGVGLALCKRIVERHDGKIWLESKIGEGSTFFFSIPKEYMVLK